MRATTDVHDDAVRSAVACHLELGPDHAVTQACARAARSGEQADFDAAERALDDHLASIGDEAGGALWDRLRRRMDGRMTWADIRAATGLEVSNNG